MITSTILNVLFYIIGLLISPITLLPNVSLSSSFATAVTTASGYLHAINALLPVDTIITIFGVSLTFELAYLVFKVIMWVIKKIPTIN